MSLTIDIRHRLGDFTLAAAFQSEGSLTALFGASGAGKTSLVHIIGGLIRPDHGSVTLAGESLVDTERGNFVPPHRRRVGYVFQEPRLFPHLSVRQNLLFGRWFAPRRERSGSLESVVDMLGVGHLLSRRPAGLSGGEKQRVALGRALLSNPRILLMDEPLASLDEARKAEILPFIERLRDETRIPIVYVSHSLSEVARLATTLVVLSGGRVVASGSASDVMSRVGLFPEAGQYEAGALLHARIFGHDEAYQLTSLACSGGHLTVPLLDLPVGSPVRIRVRARDVMVASTPPAGLSALNVLPATVTGIGVSKGAVVDVVLDCGGDRLLARITRRSVDILALSPGKPVYAVVKTMAFDPASLGGAPRERDAREFEG